MRTIRAACFLLSLALVPAGPAVAEEPAKQETRPFPASPHALHGAGQPEAVWFDTSTLPPPNPASDLGTHSYKVTTTDGGAAQRFFDQGLVYAYGFNHLEALRAFRHAQSIDRNCAMCFWGEAYVLGPNLNMPMVEAAQPVAKSAIMRAAELAATATEKEKALIAAMRERYGEGARPDLDRRYAEAAGDVARRFPDDADVATLAAEAQMLLSPWDYWKDGGKAAKTPATDEALRLLEGALSRSPGHIAAIHFYIHLVEASDRPERAAAHADRLRGAVPGAGHLVHMPGHIFFRTGRYLDAMAVNRDAAASDERYFAANAAVAGPYRSMYYPHNVHFYLSSALMLARSQEAQEAADKLSAIVQSGPRPAPPMIQPIMQAPYFVHAKFSSPETILGLPRPRQDEPLVVGAWHYARGVAFALSGDHTSARQEADLLDALAAQDFSAFDAAQIPARKILEIAAHVVRSKASVAAGRIEEAQGHATAAVRVEAELPYMEPPYWYMPSSHTMAAIQLRRDDARAAIAAFEAALAKAPNSVWALQGLKRAQVASGDTAAAADTQRRLDVIAPGLPELALERF